jgi:hypothetical protein
MDIIKKHYRTLFTRNRPEFIKEEKSIVGTDELLDRYFKNSFRYTNKIYG